MIELPSAPSPREMQPSLLDYGSVMRGASSLRIDRPGSRYRIAFAFPPMQPKVARTFTGRLQRAKREGVRVELPLSTPQGLPGAPVVDGAGQAGTALDVRGLTAKYPAREGFWLTILEADGTAYLHTIVETTVATVGGTATLQIEPPLRAPFPDGAVIELRAPYVTGFVDGDSWGWTVPVNHLVQVEFVVEEFA